MLKLLTSILATFAELEKETIVSRLQGGRKHARSAGKAYTGRPHYGQAHLPDLDGKTLHLVDAPEEQRTVDRIVELRASGMSIRRICETLAAEDIKPRTAAKWSPSVVFRIATGQRETLKKRATKRVERATAAFLADDKKQGT